MKPVLRLILIGVVLATLVVVAVGFLLPREYTVERRVTINAAPERIHALVGDLEAWPDWTPWAKSDQTMAITYGELRSGVGAHQSWSGDSGGGELTFTRSEPEWGIAYDMAFDGGKYPSRSTIVYNRAGSATEVVWTMVGDNGANPFNRYFGLMMDPMVGPMFEDGLNRLKLVAEKQDDAREPEPAPDAGAAN